MAFKSIDISNWNRKEYFEHYLKTVPCSYSMTLNLDLTALLGEIKRLDIKLYPTMLYLISSIVNKHKEFRTCFNADGNLGIFELLNPSYTIFQKDEESFTNIWTEYSPKFSDFYKNYLLDVETYGKVKSFLAKPNPPPNVFNISSIPWVSFTGFNLNLPKAMDYLLPIFTTGKYFEQNGKTWLPVSIQVHHAVCDGFHLARFVSELQESMNSLSE